jgi:hypothetical protein
LTAARRNAGTGSGFPFDLARLRGLFQASGHVDRVFRRQALLGAGHDLAGVDTDPRLHAQFWR